MAMREVKENIGTLSPKYLGVLFGICEALHSLDGDNESLAVLKAVRVELSRHAIWEMDGREAESHEEEIEAMLDGLGYEQQTLALAKSIIGKEEA